MEVRSSSSSRRFPLLQMSILPMGLTQTLFRGYVALFTTVKYLMHEAELSSPSGTKVKNE
jgi:hypothetical protein